MRSAETRQYLIKLLTLGAAYAAVGYLSSFLVAPGSVVSIVWPASAIGVAGLFLFGLDLLPAILIATFLLFIAGRGLTPPIAGAAAGADTLEALIGAWLLRRFDFRPMFDRLQDALVFALTSLVTPLITASVVALPLHYLSPGANIKQLWVGLWIGHLVSLLTFGSFGLRWGYKTHFSRTKHEWVELAAMFAFFLVTTFLTYWTPYSTIGSVPVLYISIIPLIWIALRVAGPRGMTLTLMLMALIASTGTLWGAGPIAHAPDHATVLFSIQMVVGILALIFLLFTSIVEERKEAVIALRANIERLQVAVQQISLEDQAKSDFIAILAHELRNPLSPMLSGLELLKSGAQSPEEVASMMGAHLHTMARLLDDLLDMSRISQKKFKLERVPMKLSDIVARSLEMVAPYLRERDHTLVVVESGEPLWLSADPVRVTQIVVNLLTNAAKYTDPGGKIRLETRRAGDEAIVEVSDNGLGIEQSRLKKIFEPFGPTDTGTRRGGLHIGLSLVKRMTELHQGTVEVQSRGAGHGSTFSVRLPLIPQAPLLDTESVAPRGRSRFSKAAFGHSKALGVLSILVVDDNEAAADSLAQLLRHNQHDTKVAYTGRQALVVCEDYVPTVALLDIGLPDMDGYELARRLRDKFGEDIMLVALTGYGQAEDKEKAFQAGFDEHLTKPVSIVDVERVLLELSKS